MHNYSQKIMKKSIAIMSMALLACNAYAADVLVPGTETAPKYYVIKANRGLPFVSYVAEKIDNGGAETSLHRVNDLSEEAVWAVVPGKEEGTVNIYNYTTRNEEKRKAYMFTFITKDESEFLGAPDSGTATTGGARDIYVKNNGNGSYGLALENEDGRVDGTLWALDATNNSEFLGNWQSIGDGGTQWWFYAVDVENLEGSLANIEKSVLEAEMKALVDQYANSMLTYAAAVPWVENELKEGVDALNKLEVSANYETEVEDVWNEYVGNANAALNTMFNGKTVALNNLRKYNSNNVSILSVSEDGYPIVESFANNPNAVFILESTDDEDAYYLYNEATKTYFSSNLTPVDSKEEAAPIRLMLQTGYNSNGQNPIVGLNVLVDEVDGNNAFNVGNEQNPLVVYWKASGNDSDGSIWSVLAADEQSVVDFVTSSVIEKLQPYISKVPASVAAILTEGIGKIKDLPNTDDLADQATALYEETVEAANDMLTTGLNGLQQTIYYPRGNRYLSYDATKSDWTPAVDNQSENEVFTIKVVEGGVVLFNEANNIYVGPAVEDESGFQTDVLAVEDEAEATVFTIELNSNSGYYGVSFLFDEEVTDEATEETTTRVRALNMNSNAKCLHTYGKADGGSIFVLTGQEDTAISEISAAPAVKGVYDLAGRKLAAPVKGINIVDGVKVLVK